MYLGHTCFGIAKLLTLGGLGVWCGSTYVAELEVFESSFFVDKPTECTNYL